MRYPPLLRLPLAANVNVSLPAFVVWSVTLGAPEDRVGGDVRPDCHARLARGDRYRAIASRRQGIRQAANGEGAAGPAVPEIGSRTGFPED